MRIGIPYRTDDVYAETYDKHWHYKDRGATKKNLCSDVKYLDESRVVQMSYPIARVSREKRL